MTKEHYVETKDACVTSELVERERENFGVARVGWVLYYDLFQKVKLFLT